MIRQTAFENVGKLLKGGLHCHTKRSDGKLSPEEVMKLYRAHGYDFLAITDHRCYNYKNFAPETGLTILPGMEFDNNGSMPCQYGFRVFHTVCIGPALEDGNNFEQDVLLDSAVAPTQEDYQPYLDEIHAKNNLTIHCHPQWSNTSARYFEKLQGNFAMEIWNSACALGEDKDMDAAYWDELLGQGIEIFGVATDDGHRIRDYCQGWVMVNGQNSVNGILAALKSGAFYSSCGPEIYDFYVEDGKAVLECSPAAKIRLHSDGHLTRIQRDENGQGTRAEFDLTSGWDGPYLYVRASVIDAAGKYAWTNPIFLRK